MDTTSEPLGGDRITPTTVDSDDSARSTTVTAEIPAATPYGAPPGFYPPVGGQGPPPGYGWGGWPAPGPWGQPQPAAVDDGGRRRGVLRSATTAWIVAGVLALAVVGLSIALASSPTRTIRISVPARGFGGGASAGASGSGSPFGSPGGSSGSGTNPGGFFGSGVFGTVASVGTGSFTVTDVSGQTVTVDEQSSTVYDSGGTSASSSAVVTGARVAVQGTRSANTVTATRVVVLPTTGFPSAGAGTAPAS